MYILEIVLLLSLALLIDVLLGVQVRVRVFSY